MEAIRFLWLLLLWWALRVPNVVHSVNHPALGVMLNSTLDLRTEKAILVEKDDYKAHFLKRGKRQKETVALVRAVFLKKFVFV